METQEKPMNEQESLKLIYEMINSTKRNLKDDGGIFLFWGYLTLTAALLQFSLIKLGYGESSGWVWIILMPLGGIISGVIGYRNRKKEKVKTIIDTIMAYLWGGFGACLLVVFFVLGKYDYQMAFLPMIMMLYGIGTFVTGGFLKFRPLILGGISCWVFAVAACFFSIEIHLILIALSLVTSYIIPGHLLLASESNN